MKKQSGDKAASDAAFLLNLVKKAPSGHFHWMDYNGTWTNITARVKRVAASVLSQDETKGPRKKRRK